MIKKKQMTGYVFFFAGQHDSWGEEREKQEEKKKRLLDLNCHASTNMCRTTKKSANRCFQHLHRSCRLATKWLIMHCLNIMDVSYPLELALHMPAYLPCPFTLVPIFDLVLIVVLFTLGFIFLGFTIINKGLRYL